MYISNSFCLFLTDNLTLDAHCNDIDDSSEVKGHPAGINASIIGRNAMDVEKEVILSEVELRPFLKKLTALREKTRGSEALNRGYGYCGVT